MHRLDFFWQKNRETVQGWLFSFVFHGVFAGAALFMMTNLMMVKKPKPIPLDISLIKPPPEPVEQPQPVHKTVMEQQIVEKQEFEKEVSEKEVVNHKIVEQQIELNNVSAQEIVDQILVRQEKVTEQRTKQTTTKRQMVQVTDTVEAQVPQQQQVTSQAVSRVAAPTPVTHAVAVKAASNTNHRQVATVAKPAVRGNHQVKRPSTIQEVPVVSGKKTTTTELAVKPIPSSVEKVAAISSGAVRKSRTRVHHAPTQRSAVAKVIAQEQSRSLAVQSTPQQVIQETTLTKTQPPVVTREIKQNPIVVTDYNWIADTLSEEVKRLKRYPTRAKRRKWEGTVELRVSIRADGEIQAVHVLESSGHTILDQEALQTVRMASPLTLIHLVDRPLVMVDLPIVYELN